jgi:N-acetylglucosaminyldiphosphoundecaprenol N-acetyl-beta-D-mannosaminyltransferase
MAVPSQVTQAGSPASVGSRTEDPARPQISLMGCAIDAITYDEAFQTCLAWSDDAAVSRLVVPVNVAVLMMMRRAPDLRDAAARGDLVVADGLPLVWASRLVGEPLPERINGCDLMTRLLAEGGRHGLRVYFLGATEEVVTRLVEIVREQHPALEVAGYRNGYFSEEECPEVVRQVRESGADILFVGISSPFKETWSSQYREELSVPVILCVGGSFDVLAGFVRRAPRWVQKVGMEWFWRFGQEPRRLWKRYLVNNSLFLWLLARTILSRAPASDSPAQPFVTDGE